MGYKIFSVFILSASVFFAKAQIGKQTFDFSGQRLAASGTISLDSVVDYASNEKGYGFDFDSGTAVHFTTVRGKQTLYSDKPFYFSINLKEGNYKVTLYYKGLPERNLYSTVRSESRRWSLEKVLVNKKKNVVKSFVVNIKDATIKDSLLVKLKKPREVEKMDWDNKMTLEFQGENNLEKIVIEPVTVTTLFLAGNSTVVNQEDEPWASWGQMIPRYFDTSIAVANHAESGLALSSFLSSNRLDKILAVAQPGDYLFIEFGHNDQKEKGADAGAFNGYADRLRLFVNKFRAIGGYPVIVTSTARRSFDEYGALLYTLGDFPAAARQVAQEMNVPLIDLNKMTRDFYLALGVEESKHALVHYAANTFPNQKQSLQDNTHFNTYGASQIAKMVLMGIKEEKIPISKNIVDFSSYDPNHPDAFEAWDWPLSIKTSPVKPDGN